MFVKVKRHIVKSVMDMKECFLHMYYRCTTQYNRLNYKEIPIIINNFNRLGYLKRLVQSLEKKGYKHLVILDNASTYPPLLEWYSTCPYEIIYLGGNYGHKALWESGKISMFNHDYFVYTDPDLELLDECPDDFLLQMLNNLKKRVKGQKIGLSLKIDDLPECYKHKQKVIEWESRFSNTKEYGMYLADIDTTFALYEPYAAGGFVDDMITYRMPYPIQCRHLPWYEDSANISEEDMYYASLKQNDIGWWSSKILGDRVK